MSERHLLCAHCGGLVAEGRCATCRASREMLRPDPLPAGPVLVAALLLLVVLLALA